MSEPYVKLYCFTNSSPGEVSFCLRRRGVTHSFVYAKSTIKQSGFIQDQPIDVMFALFDGVQRIKPKRPTAVLLFGHKANVLNEVTELTSGGDGVVRWMLHDALVPSIETSIRLGSVKPHEHIERVSPPSFLDRYNTVQCKITPYSLRQEAHKIAMGYLTGAVKHKTARKFFNTSLKLEPMAEIVFSERGTHIQKAISECHGWSEVDAKAEQHGFERFELMYILKSYAKLYGKGKEK